eukprot:COSAG06_NODE_7115_length_2626_cov_1.981401_2_plen_228_part_00
MPGVPVPVGSGDTITTAEAQAYQRAGVLVKHDFFDVREVAAMQRAVREFKRRDLLHDMYTKVGPRADGEMKYMAAPATVSRLFRSLLFKPEFKAAIEALIGPASTSVGQFFTKPARTGLGTQWHQDNAYFHIDDPTEGVAVWIAVDNCTKEAGTLHVLPGSHLANRAKEGLLEHKCFDLEISRFSCAESVPQEDAVACETNAGGVVFFSCGCTAMQLHWFRCVQRLR